MNTKKKEATFVVSFPGIGRGGGTRIPLLTKGFNLILLPVCGLVCGNNPYALQQLGVNP